MKIRSQQQQKLKIKPIVWIVGGLVLTLALVTVGVFMFNIFGVQKEGHGETVIQSKYPFDLADPALTQVNFTILPLKINSVFEEVRPFVSGDGKQLFFCRRNHPGNINKQKDKQDIWYCNSIGNGLWSDAINLGAPINSKNADAVCNVSDDGNEIYFISDVINADEPISKSTRTGSSWSKPVPMTIENFYNLNPYIDFYCASKPRILLLAIQREDSKGEQDLYVSLSKGENKWGEPINLGSVVNTSKSEFAPFLSADGKTLYFSSYGHKGLGGCDIYMTTRADDTWKHWSAPRNLGKGINSSREESYFSISDDYKYIYFESYDLEHEVRDIFRADLPSEDKPAAYQVRLP